MPTGLTSSQGAGTGVRSFAAPFNPYQPNAPLAPTPGYSPSGRGINPLTGSIGSMPGGMDYLAGLGPAPKGVHLKDPAPIIHYSNPFHQGSFGQFTEADRQAQLQQRMNYFGQQAQKLSGLAPVSMPINQGPVNFNQPTGGQIYAHPTDTASQSAWAQELARRAAAMPTAALAPIPTEPILNQGKTPSS